jgi:hypothetical protein
MAVLTPVHHRHELMKRIGEAIGVPFPWNRLVIECDVRDVVRVYVTAPVDAERFRKVCEAFEALGVESVAVDPLTHSVVYVPVPPKE